MKYLIKVGLEGLKRILTNRGFTLCEKVQRQLEEYEENNNPIILFFKEIEEEQIINEPTRNVYQKYQEFCIVNSFQPMSNIEFSKQIKKQFDLDIVNRKIKGEKFRIFVRR